MSQVIPDSQVPKSSKKGRGAKHDSNQFIYEKFDALKKAAMFRNNKNVYNCYAKIMRSLEKHPTPILNAQQALQMDGVGPKMAALIGNLIKKRGPTAESLEFSEELSNDFLDSTQSQQAIPMSQTARFTSMIEGDFTMSDNSNNSTNGSVRQMTSSVVSKYVPVKRNREEDDVFEVPKSALKKSYTVGDEFSMEDEYNSSSLSSDLWNAADFPEINSSSVPAPLSKLTEKLTKNTTTKKLKNYRPEKNTSGFNVLVGLLKFENDTKKKYASKKEIRETLKKDPEFSDLQITSWAPLATLIKYELIDKLSLNEEEKFSLTESGFRIANECFIEKTKNADPVENASTIESSKPNSNFKDEDIMIVEAQNSISTTVSSFNTASFGSFGTESLGGFFDMQSFDDSIKAGSYEVPSFDEPPKNKTAEKPPSKTLFFMNRMISGVKENPMRLDETDGTVTFAQYEKMSEEKPRPEREETTEIKTEKKTERKKEKKADKKTKSEPENKENTQVGPHQVRKSSIEVWNLVLHVDNREIRSQKERDYIFEKFQNNGVNCKQSNLSLGDFLWTIEIGNDSNKVCYVLDYVIERKTADDLASSILDRRYNQQKFRLMNCNIKNIFYLVEGRATQNAQLPQSTIDSAILNTQIQQKFKVRTTQSLQDSIRFITEMHQAIETRFMRDMADENNEHVTFKYKFDEYQTASSKTQCLSTKILFGNMLRTIKGCGKEVVTQILDEFDTLPEFYQALNKLSGETERLEMLGAVKKKKSKKSKNLIIVQEQEQRLHLNKTVAGHVAKLFCENPYTQILGKKASELNEDIAG